MYNITIIKDKEKQRQMILSKTFKNSNYYLQTNENDI